MAINDKLTSKKLKGLLGTLALAIAIPSASGQYQNTIRAYNGSPLSIEDIKDKSGTLILNGEEYLNGVKQERFSELDTRFYAGSPLSINDIKDKTGIVYVNGICYFNGVFKEKIKWC